MEENKYISGAELIAKSLEIEGVNQIFTLAGDHVLPTLDVLEDYGFNILDTRHEQAAVHMADSWSRITGQVGVAIYTTPGFANAIPGLANAMHAESPILSISGSAELSEVEKGSMQEIDQIGMAKPTTKGSWMVYDAARIPDMIAKALKEYADVGVDCFILSGWPHVEEAEIFGNEIMPLLQATEPITL